MNAFDGNGAIEVAPADVGRRALRHDLPARDDDDAIGERLRLVHVVRGEQHRLAERGEVGDDVPRLAPRARVEDLG